MDKKLPSWDSWIVREGQAVKAQRDYENRKAAADFLKDVKPQSRGSVGRPSASAQREKEIRGIAQRIDYDRTMRQADNPYKRAVAKVPNEVKKAYSTQTKKK